MKLGIILKGLHEWKKPSLKYPWLLMASHVGLKMIEIRFRYTFLDKRRMLLSANQSKQVENVRDEFFKKGHEEIGVRK